MSKFFIIVFIGALTALVSAQNFNNNTLLCYTCNPSSNPSSCANPLNGAPVVNCSASVTNNTAFRHSCFSAYLVYNTSGSHNLTGIHRGCYTTPNITGVPNNYCALNPGVNITRRGCNSCGFSYCNSQLFNSAGLITGDGGGGSGGGGSGGGGSGGGSGGSGNRPNGSSTLSPTIFVLTISLILSYVKNCNPFH